jgi:hypothetical protein
MSPFVSALVNLQSTDASDSALLNKIIQLFNNFRAKLEAEYLAKVGDEEAAIAHYNSEVNRLE